MEKNRTILGDCIEVMKEFPDKCFDAIICDLPYQKTKNSWDVVISPNKLWNRYERIIKDHGAIILFGQDKFTAKMMLSNEKIHRYNIIWEKTTSTGFLNAKKMPLRNHEDIMVFYKKLPTYNPQKTKGNKRKVSKAEHKMNSKTTTNYGEHELTTYDSTERYPRSIWKFSTDKQKRPLHPTQKPLALLEELVRTYTNEGDLVLDNCAGSGTTGLACMRNNRDYIMIEKDKKNFDIIINRIEEQKI